MTQILLDEYSEVNSRSWTYDTLKPPKLTVKNIYKDLKWHIRLYKNSELSFRTICIFIFLRMTQRIFYNLGWKNGGKKIAKS